MNKLLVCAGGVVVMSLLANAGCSSTSGGDGVGAEGGYGAGTGSGGSSASGGGLGLGGNGASIAVGGMAGSGAGGGGGLVCDPGAYDIPGNNFDDDCDGQIDNEVVGCDGAIPDIGYADPMSAAQAIGLCKVAQGGSWGVIEAKYVKADGTTGMNPTSHGLLPNFGPNVQTQEGQRLLALSSGAARRPGDVGYLTPQDGSMGTQSPQPPASRSIRQPARASPRVATRSIRRGSSFEFASQPTPRASSSPSTSTLRSTRSTSALPSTTSSWRCRIRPRPTRFRATSRSTLRTTPSA